MPLSATNCCEHGLAVKRCHACHQQRAQKERMICKDAWYSSPKAKHILRLVFHIIVLAVFWAGGIIRFIEEPTYFFTYLTHWSWTYQTIVYSLLFVGKLWAPSLFLWTVFIAYIGHILLFSTVASLVIAAIAYDAAFLLQFIHEFGGDLDARMVLIGNFLFHTLPVFLGLIFTCLYWTPLSRALHAPVRHIGGVQRVLIMILQIYAPVAVVTGTYYAIFDPHEVYKIDIPDYVGWTVTFCTATIIGVFVYYYSLPTRATKRKKYKSKV